MVRMPPPADGGGAGGAPPASAPPGAASASGSFATIDEDYVFPGDQQQQQQQQKPKTRTTSEVEAVASEDRTVATLSSPWQYDSLQPNCSGCHAAFSPVNRRHHCRLCGKIFCNDCTKHKSLIPPSSIVLAPVGGKKASPKSAQQIATFSPDQDPDRMLTYISHDNKELLYGRGLEERFKLAREPLRVCQPCHNQLAPIQHELRASNSNAVRFNHVDPTDARRLFNSPLAFTLGHEIRKAAYTLNNLLPLPKRMGAVVNQPTFSNSSDPYDDVGSSSNNPPSELQQCRETCSTMSPNLGNLDGVRIPARMLEQAKGVAVMTVAKGGFGLAGIEFGTGLVVARLDENRWSAPSAIGTAGISWGALFGAQVSDHVFLLMNDNAVEMLFSDKGSVTLGADIGIAVGPLGRAAEASLGAAPGGGGGPNQARPATTAPIYTYSMSKGFFAGVSLDGKVIVSRPNVNEKFYGAAVTASEILRGAVPIPPAAQPLYEALTRCHFYATGGAAGSRRNRLQQQQQTGTGNTTFFPMQQSSIMSMYPALDAAPFHQPQYQLQDPVMSEYGELTVPPESIAAGGRQGGMNSGGSGDSVNDGLPTMPPASGDQHSYAGMSDITSDFG